MNEPVEIPSDPAATASGKSIASPWRWRAEGLILLALLVTLAGPFLLKPRNAATGDHYDRRLVILSPHNERIRQEIGHAFAADWQARTGEKVYIDWRIPGGASEIALFLKSEFAGAFQYTWATEQQHTWTHEVASGFTDPRTPAIAGNATSNPAAEARRAFLESSVGVGVDLLFGGGSYDFQQLADAGYLVASGKGSESGITAIKARHPDWFTPAVIPLEVSGEPFRDRQDRWVGVILATFGMVYNRDVLNRLNIPRPPEQWSDLGDSRLEGQLAMSDPTKSGSVAKAFELIIQQQMQQAVTRLAADNSPNAEAEGIRQGWLSGLRLIEDMSANARYFTDSGSKIPLEVARGDAAAGMAIDSYGRATQEYVRQPDGYSRVGFVAPIGGTSVSVDPVAMLRGAPDPVLATAFMEFLLSTRGQKLWAFRPGTPEGPASTALRRLPVRRDFYTPEHRRYMTDADEDPYAQAERFVYHPSWTGPVFGAIRFLIRVMCVDNHVEQQTAWRAINQRGHPAAALAAFHELSGLSYDDVLNRIMSVLRSRDKVAEVVMARELGATLRDRYQRAEQLARQSEQHP